LNYSRNPRATFPPLPFSRAARRLPLVARFIRPNTSGARLERRYRDAGLVHGAHYEGQTKPSYPGRPDMVHNCTTSNTSTNSFSVRCAEGFNGGLPQSFLLEVRESNSQELRANLTSSVPRFSVTHLESGALYQACIYASGNRGLLRDTCASGRSREARDAQ